MFKKVILNTFLTHFNNDNFIISEQLGFLLNSSTEKTAFDIICEILEASSKQDLWWVYSSIWNRHLIVLIMAFY
jgi:hypothetical protein